MINLDVVVAILIIHWVGDFVGQSHDMACNKSKSIGWLGYHCFIYGLVLLIFFNPMFALFNMLAHYLIDYFTSKMTASLWLNGDYHNFFVMIGFDQLLHLIILMLTYSVFNI